MAGLKAKSVAVAADRVGLGLLDDYIGFNLRLAQDASFRTFARKSGRTDIKPGHFAALLVIEDNPGIGQGELGRAIARDKSTVTPLIQALAKRGLVERKTSTGDRRRIHLFITAAGRALLRRLARHARSHDRKLDAIVGDDKALFLVLLKRIANELG